LITESLGHAYGNVVTHVYVITIGMRLIIMQMKKVTAGIFNPNRRHMKEAIFDRLLIAAVSYTSYGYAKG